MGEALTQAEVDTLPAGTRVLVTWSGGNGPHEYVIVVCDGKRYAALPEGHPWRRPDEDTRPPWDAVLEWVGEHPRTQVWLLNPKESPTP